MRWVRLDCCASSQPVIPPSRPAAAFAAADGETAAPAAPASARRPQQGGAGQTQRVLQRRLVMGRRRSPCSAILKPKLAPGERLVKNDLLSFVLSGPSSGFGLATEAEHPGGGGDERRRILSSNSKSMKYSGSATRKGGRTCRRGAGFFRGIGHMELRPDGRAALPSNSPSPSRSRPTCRRSSAS